MVTHILKEENSFEAINTRKFYKYIHFIHAKVYGFRFKTQLPNLDSKELTYFC